MWLASLLDAACRFTGALGLIQQAAAAQRTALLEDWIGY
jgi:hypothetical protein